MQGEIKNAAHDAVSNSDLRNAFDESLHPRGKDGEFMSIGTVTSSGVVKSIEYKKEDAKLSEPMHDNLFSKMIPQSRRFRYSKGVLTWGDMPTATSYYAAESHIKRIGLPAVIRHELEYRTKSERIISPDNLDNRDLANAAATLGIGEPLVDATEHIDAKTPIGTLLSSKQIREQWPREFRQRSQFSAKVESVKLLQNFQDDLQRAIKGMRDENGALMSRSRFISDNMSLAKQYGLDTGTKGITNPASIGRLGLVFDTQTSMEAGYANKRMGEQELDVSMEPCWELLEDLNPDVPRGTKLVHGELVDDEEDGWPARFRAACEESGDDEALACLEATGRMVARKDSGVWQALGDGAGGYDDTLGNDFSPFAYRSGMRLFGVPRDECEELGFTISDIEPPDDSKFDDGEDDNEPDDDGGFNDGLEADTSDLEPEFADLLVESLADYCAYDAATGILKWIGKAIAGA